MNFVKNYTLLGIGPPATATGTTLSTAPVVDLTGYTGALVLCNPNVTATNNGLAAVVGTASGTLSDLAGTWTTAHTTALILDVIKPSGGKFFSAQLRQGTSGRHGPIYIFGVGSRVRPTTGHVAALTHKLVAYPGTGTATSS
jgi:hypothetical protein